MATTIKRKRYEVTLYHNNEKMLTLETADTEAEAVREAVKRAEQMAMDLCHPGYTIRVNLVEESVTTLMIKPVRKQVPA